MRHTYKNVGRGERWGAALARMWRGIQKLERGFGSLLARVGCPAGLVITIRWILRAGIFVIAALNFAAFAIICTAALLVASRMTRNSDLNLAEGFEGPKLRDGLMGFGLYDRYDFRVDPHEPNDPTAGP